VEELTGMSHSTISKGIEELKTSEKLEPPERLRAHGGGRKKVEIKDPGRSWAKKGQAKEVNVGMSYDTSEFAVESLRQWWLMFGRNNYPNTKELMICADGGGSNGSRNKGWKFHLQKLEREAAC
jgi:hypothetical protein